MKEQQNSIITDDKKRLSAKELSFPLFEARRWMYSLGTFLWERVLHFCPLECGRFFAVTGKFLPTSLSQSAVFAKACFCSRPLQQYA